MNIGDTGLPFQMNATFNAPVENWGAVKVGQTIVFFNDTYTEHGSYSSYVSAHLFKDLIVQPTGFLVSNYDYYFLISNDFLNRSQRKLDWQTKDAWLLFGPMIGPASHIMAIPGLDLGPVSQGYVDNFSWRRLTLYSLQDLYLTDADPVFNGGALYFKEIDGLAFDPLDPLHILNIHSTNGLNLYYDPVSSPKLSGLTYNLEGGGYLIPVPGLAPVPVPGTVWLLISGLASITGIRKWRAKN